MFHSIILRIFQNSLPLIIISSIIIVSLRLVYIIKNKKDFIFYREVLYLVFIIYIICLFYIVSFEDVNWSTSNFVPFKELLRYRLGTRLFYKNIIGNITLFLPYGFLVSYFIKIEKTLSIFLLTLLTSISIETTQLMIGRVFDIDDILLNLIGGLSGYFIYKLLQKLKDKLPNSLKRELIYNIIILVLLITIGCYLIGVFLCLK